FTINGAGSIQTTNAQTLTIGGSTTGNIVLNGFTGNNAVLYGTAGSGILASATIGVAGQCFTSSGTPFAPSWQACPGSGSGASKWSAVLTSIVPTDITDKVGIGTASDVPSSFYVTRDLASGALGKALAIFDQTESQDILTASAGGTTRFRIQNTGELVFGDDTSSFFGTLNPTTLTANRTYTFPNADGTICLNSNNCSFALGTNYWTIPTNTGALTPINSTLDLLIGGTTTSSANLRVTGNSAFAGTTSAASIAAKTSFAGFVVDNTGAGDLFTASKSGATKFTILNNGNIQFAGTTSNLLTLAYAGGSNQTITFPAATGTLCLQNSSSCGFALGTNFWTETSNPGGALTTINSTMDLLIGGQTTASAKFAVLNMTGSGTPTASISAGTGITGGAFLTAAGNLATTNKQSLTLGGVDTGNIVISGLATGFVKSTGGVLSSSSTVNLASSDVSGILPTANGGSWWNSSLGAVYTGNSTLDLLIGGTTTSSANLRVTGSSAFAGTTSAASIAAKTSFAGFVVDN
ncbi:MAG: hypothetical protein AABY02_04560, partial [Nanoarchaeota archaeon]